jgi:hypothetical protein
MLSWPPYKILPGFLLFLVSSLKLYIFMSVFGTILATAGASASPMNHIDSKIVYMLTNAIRVNVL